MANGGSDRWGLRAPVVAVAVVLAVLAGSVGVVTAWSRATLIDTEGYVEAVAVPLTNDPEVKDAVARELATQITTGSGSDLSANLQQWLPPEAALARAAVDQWAQQIEEAWRQQLGPSIRAQMDLPSFNELWIEANRQSHRQLIAAIQEDQDAQVVTVDLRAIVQQAVREAGVQVDRQLNLPGEMGTTIFAAMADSLPPEAGRISLDVSRIGPQARTALELAGPLMIGSFAAAALFALLAVGIAPRRRRGTAVAVLGLGVVLMAGGLWSSVSGQADQAGERASALAVQPFSPDMRFVVDRQAELVTETFRGWAIGAGLAGLALLAVGIVWRLVSGRARPEPAYGGPSGPSGHSGPPGSANGYDGRPYRTDVGPGWSAGAGPPPGAGPGPAAGGWDRPAPGSWPPGPPRPPRPS